MVQYSIQLDSIFASFADSTRRDILSRLSGGELKISALVANYNMSFSAVAKHIRVLERAELIVKRKEGREQIVSLTPQAFIAADEYLEQYRQMWQTRFNKLDILINKGENNVRS